jgi:hypothetical protein
MNKRIIIVLACLCLAGSLQAAMTHRYSFEENANDVVGGLQSTLIGDAYVSDGSLICDGIDDWMEMDSAGIAINTYTTGLTLELWSTQDMTNQGYTMTAAFGDVWPNGNGRDYLSIATARGDDVSRAMFANTPDQDSPWGDEVGVNGDELNDNLEHYYVLTIDDPETDGSGQLAFYIDGQLRGTVALNGTKISALSNTNAYLGRGTYDVDAEMRCSINEFRIYNSALTAQEILEHYYAGPDVIESLVAYGASPKNLATDVLRDGTVLSWRPGSYAANHNVYFGETFEDIDAATTNSPLFRGNQSDTTYPIAGRLELGKTYYWRIDEVNDLEPGSPWKGNVWSFTTEAVGIPLTGDLIMATASSSTNTTQVPSKTIDGSGLLANDLHTNLLDDMWLSSLGDTDPWIQYEFDKPYKLYQILVWNHNSPLEPPYGLGVQDVNVVYSLDGMNWIDIGTPQVIPQATGTSDNGINGIIEMGNVYAKYVKLLIKSNRNPFGAPQYGLSEVRFLYIPTWARELEPADATDGLDPIVSLSWRGGREAAKHQVYLGTDANNMSLAGSTTESAMDVYVDLSSTYYWRVVEVNAVEDPCSWISDIQSFSTVDFITIDDMESYRDAKDFWIWQAWDDGVGDPPGNGSVVGHGDLPEMEIVFEGSQSMPMRYNGPSEATYSPAWTDWTAGSVQSLRFTFSGESNDTGSGLYVRLNDGQEVYYPDDGDLKRTQWTQWDLPLSSFSDVDLTDVTNLTIGVTSGHGILYIDAVGLYPEVAEVAMPVNPGSNGLAARYSMEGNMSDSSGNGLNGEVFGGALFNQGMAGMGRTLTLDGMVDYATLPISSVIASADSMTIALWADHAGGDVWQRLIDFGSDTTSYMFLSPENGTTNVLRFAITTAGNAAGAESILDGPGALAPGWHHVAVSIDGSTMSMTLYLDGIAVATGTTATLPSDLGNTTQNYVGDSQYTADPFYSGDIDELLIYTRALSLGEIRYLAGER